MLRECSEAAAVEEEGGKGGEELGGNPLNTAQRPWVGEKRQEVRLSQEGRSGVAPRSPGA